MALRRVVPKVLTLDLGYLRMWRDDLDRMVTVLEKISSHVTEIKVDDYELDNVADLAELALQNVYSIRSFTFTGGTSDEVKLQLGEDISLLQIAGDDLAAKGAAQEIYEIAFSCRRVVLPEFSASVSGALVAATPVVGRAIYNVLSGSRGSDRSNRRVILDTRTRREAPTFWAAKKHDVWITVVSNITSLILGGVIGYFVNVWTAGKN